MRLVDRKGCRQYVLIDAMRIAPSRKFLSRPRATIGILTLFCASGTLAPPRQAKAAQPEPALAPHVTVSLRFGAGEMESFCADEALFQKSVIARLGFDPFRQSADYAITIRSTDSPDGPSGSITWHDSAGHLEGERHFESASGDCASLLTNMGFAVAIRLQLLESLRVAEPPEEQREAPEIRTPPPPSAVGSSPPARTPTTNPEDEAKLSVGLGAGVGYGLLPHPSLLGAGMGELVYSPLMVRLGLEFCAPQSWRAPDQSGFRSLLVLASASACYAWGPLGLCAVGRVGWLSVQGFGVEAPLRPAEFVGWLGPGANLSLPLGGRWSVGWQADVARNLSGYSVTLRGKPVWNQPDIALTSGVSIAYALQ